MRPGRSRFLAGHGSGPERVGVKGDMFFDEARNEEIAVVIALLHAQAVRHAFLGHGLGQGFGPEQVAELVVRKRRAAQGDAPRVEVCLYTLDPLGGK